MRDQPRPALCSVTIDKSKPSCESRTCQEASVATEAKVGQVDRISEKRLNLAFHKKGSNKSNGLDEWTKQMAMVLPFFK